MDNPTERLFRRIFYIALITLPSIIAVATFRDHSLNVSLLFWLAELFLLLILGLAAYEARGELASPSRLAVGLSLIVLATSLSAALLNAINQSTAIGHLVITTTHFLVALTVFCLFANAWASERRTMLLAIFCSALLQVVTTFFLIAVAAGIPDFDWLYFHGAVGNVRQLGFVAVVLCALASSLASSARKSAEALWLYLALAVGLVFVGMIGGRASFGAATLSVIFAILVSERQVRTRNLRASLVCFAVSLPSALIYTPPHSAWGLLRIFGATVGTNSEANYTNGRLAVWKRTFEKLVEQPWIGFGEAQYVELVKNPAMALNHPHNFILQFLFQWGIIGTIAVLCLAGLVALRAFRARHEHMNVFIPAAAVILAMTTMAMLEGNFFHVYPQLVSAIALALLATVSRTQCVRQT